jgi:hypothetical protein
MLTAVEDIHTDVRAAKLPSTCEELHELCKKPAIIVSNIALAITQNELIEYFQFYGQLFSVAIFRRGTRQEALLVYDAQDKEAFKMAFKEWDSPAGLDVHYLHPKMHSYLIAFQGKQDGFAEPIDITDSETQNESNGELSLLKVDPQDCEENSNDDVRDDLAQRAPIPFSYIGHSSETTALHKFPSLPDIDNYRTNSSSPGGVESEAGSSSDSRTANDDAAVLHQVGSQDGEVDTNLAEISLGSPVELKLTSFPRLPECEDLAFSSKKPHSELPGEIDTTDRTPTSNRPSSPRQRSPQTSPYASKVATGIIKVTQLSGKLH